MIDHLKKRLAELQSELKLANDAQREELLEHLEQVVAGLEAQGCAVPGWAKALMASRVDENVENMFDNMPV